MRYFKQSKQLKKALSLVLALAFTVSSFTAAGADSGETQPGQTGEYSAQSAQNGSEPAVTIGINSAYFVNGGKKGTVNPPVKIFDKTYIDLYAFANILNYRVNWIAAEIGYFTVTAGNKSVNFTPISKYDDLINQSGMFFVKDSNIFVSLREISDLCGYPIVYDKGIIYIGSQNTSAKSDITGASETDSNDYVYTHYPVWAQYVVHPYKAYSYSDMLGDAEKLAYMYPDLIKLSSIGKSVEGRNLLLMEFGRGKRKVFVCGTHHAREYIATTYLMYAIDRYSYAYRTNTPYAGYSAKDILDEITFCIVPMVNPDGVNLVQNGLYSTPYAPSLSQMGIYDGAKYGYSSWKANIHGVDVNWNYDKDWSAERNKNGRGSTGFNGDYPASEPETVAVSNYVDSMPFDAYFSFHTQGQVYYWCDSKSKPMHLQDVVGRVTGFKGERDSGTGIGGSFFDYVYRKYDKPMITVELCPYVGNYPYPNSDFDTVWKPAKNILLAVGNEIIYLNK